MADLLTEAPARERMVAAARTALGDGRGATQTTLAALLPLLPPRAGGAVSAWAGRADKDPAPEPPR